MCVRETTEEKDRELVFIEYRVGFRVYPELCKNWEIFKRHWPNKEVMLKDSRKRTYFGDHENLDEWIPYYSNRIEK